MAYINDRNVAYGVLSGDTSDIVDGSITEPKLADNSVSTRTIIDGNISYAKFANDVVTAFNNKHDVQKLTGISGGVTVAIDETALNEINFDKYTFYYVWLAVNVLYTESPREWVLFFQLDALNQFAVRPNGDIYKRSQAYAGAGWSDFTRTTATIETLKMAKPSKAYGFDADGNITKAETGGSNYTAGDLVGSIKVFIPYANSININSGFKSTSPNLTDIYIEQTEDNVTIDQSILSDTNITIHYIGTFNTADLFIGAIKALTDKVKDLENTVGTVNTLLENSLNGVSE